MSKLFLLSVDEVVKILQKILACNNWWWLRSPGNNTSYAAYVFIDGSLYANGDNVFIDGFSVRPALYLKFSLSDIGLEFNKEGYVELGITKKGDPIE